MILQNIEESLITISQNKIRQTNQQFKKLFSEILTEMDYLPSDANEPRQVTKKSCIKRLSQQLKELFLNVKPSGQETEDFDQGLERIKDRFLKTKMF